MPVLKLNAKSHRKRPEIRCSTFVRQKFDFVEQPKPQIAQEISALQQRLVRHSLCSTTRFGAVFEAFAVAICCNLLPTSRLLQTVAICCRHPGRSFLFGSAPATPFVIEGQVFVMTLSPIRGLQITPALCSHS